MKLLKLKKLDKLYYLHGNKYMFNKQYEEAIKAFKKSIEEMLILVVINMTKQ